MGSGWGPARGTRSSTAPGWPQGQTEDIGTWAGSVGLVAWQDCGELETDPDVASPGQRLTSPGV